MQTLEFKNIKTVAHDDVRTFSFLSRATVFILLLCGVPSAPLYAQVAPGEQQAGGAAAGFLGVELWDLTAEIAPLLGRTPANGAFVTQAMEGSPAAGAGLRPGDLIVDIDGVAIIESADVVRKVGALAPGTRMQLGVIREGAERTIAVTLGQRPPPPAQPSEIERLRADCNEGDLATCALAGIRYARGDGVPQNPFLAVMLLAQACAGGYASGCVLLGDLYRDGQGVPGDYTRAAELYREACDDGHAPGCDRLGWLYLEAYRTGLGTPEDLARAAVLYKQACDGGVTESCGELGDLYSRGHGVVQNHRRSAELLDQACEGGYGRACYALADAYAFGLGVAQDGARTAALYQQACDRGYGPACLGLDLTSRAQKACDGGDPKGCFNLARRHERGLGVAADEAQIAALYQRACDLGSSEGCTKVSAMPRAESTAAAARGWLGAGVQDLTAETAAALGRPPAKGALVVQVVDDAPAAKAGLTDGDLIIAVDGKEIGPARELVEAMARLAPGAETRLTIVRDGIEQTLRVIIEQRP